MCIGMASTHFATVALYGGAVGNLEDLYCRSYKIALPELQQKATTMHLLMPLNKGESDQISLKS